MKNKNGGDSTREVGIYYETKAVEYLKKSGYHIIERNFRCKQGEIDIIAREENYLCFIEVKYRTTSNFGAAVEAVSYYKQKRISRTALYYLTMHGYTENQLYRFDVLGVTPDGFRLIKNAFEYRG